MSESASESTPVPPAPEVAAGSPPPVREMQVVEAEFLQARQRLSELRSVLIERFDRRTWEEYVRLRRRQAATSRVIDA